jgi:nickel-dependent lactate racemase
MRITFPYSGFEALEIPDQNLLGTFIPSVIKVEKSEEQVIEEAFAHPIGAPSLDRMLNGREKVLVVVDDYTRSTPVHKILPYLIRAMERIGIKNNNIKILIALGTHRPMTRVEILAKIGLQILERFPIMNHSWWDPSRLINLGETETGTPIFVNRMAMEVDFIIGIGQIVPHRVSGFSGGGNIIQPGICGEETTGKTHWLSAQFTGREILGKVENPVKEEIERVARRTALKWIVNAIQDGSGRLVAAVAGNPVQAYRSGAKQSLGIYRSELPREADIVIADSHPYDSELWLASKGIYASELAVKQDGVVILISPCSEGVSPSHPEVLELGYQRFETVDQWIREKKIQKLTAAAHLVHVGRVIKERARTIFVSHGISKEQKERLGFIHAKNPKEALDMALGLMGRDAKVAVLQRGGEILPAIKGSAV